MHILEIFIINLIVIANINQSVVGNVKDFCALGCAKPNRTHAVCANKEMKLIGYCPPDAKIIPLDDIQETILQLHNEKRQLIASGKTLRLPPAARMGELHWDPDLADLAEYSVRRCLISDPHCYTTPTLSNPGRSANNYKFQAIKVPYEQLIPSRIVQWFETGEACTPEIAANFPAKVPGHVDFFGRAIMDSNNQVGCAASEWIKEKSKYSLLVCLYTHDVETDKPLYKFGVPGSRCLTGTSNRFPNLCSKYENYSIVDPPNKRRRLIQVDKVKKRFETPEGSLWQMIL